MRQPFSRRELIRTGVIAAIGAPLAGYAGSTYKPAYIKTTGKNKDPWHGLKVGIASYSFRKMSVENTIKAMQRLDLKYISIKDFHLSLKSSAAERKEVISKFTGAGIKPLSCGNITMQNDEANIRNAFEYARDCGIPTIVCSPDPGSMPILDRMVKEFNIRLAIHNHGPEDKHFPSPDEVWNAVKPYDARIGLCIDVGHTVRAKVDPAKAIVKYRERLYDLHIKDIASTEPDGETVAAGRGVMDLAAIIRAVLKIRYPYLLSVEYESTPEDPLPEVAETIGYLKGMLNIL